MKPFSIVWYIFWHCCMSGFLPWYFNFVVQWAKLRVLLKGLYLKQSGAGCLLKQSIFPLDEDIQTLFVWTASFSFSFIPPQFCFNLHKFLAATALRQTTNSSRQLDKEKHFQGMIQNVTSAGTGVFSFQKTCYNSKNSEGSLAAWCWNSSKMGKEIIFVLFEHDQDYFLKE